MLRLPTAVRPRTVAPQAPRARPATRTPSTRRRDLQTCLGEGAAYGAMVGVGEAYLPAFVLAVGLGQVTAGLVASLPLLGGGLMQLVSPYAVRFLRSHKKWVLICATIQGATFVPLAIAAYSGSISIAAVMFIATLYWGAGLATGPAWNTWVGSLVPRPLRPGFFARRTRLTQIAILAGLLGGGLLLHDADSKETQLLVFVALFGAAALSRATSVTLLALQSEPAAAAARAPESLGPALSRRLFHTPGGRLLQYLAAAQGAIQISGPYYAPYMLKTLHFSYAQYATLIAVAFAAKIIALPYLGRLTHRVGARAMLTWSACAIAPLAAAWIVSGSFAWLLFVQVVSGVSWAAYELAFFLLFIESFHEEERTQSLTVYNVANNSAHVAGSALGALLLLVLGVNQQTYYVLFATSSIARLLVLPLLRRVDTLPTDAHPFSLRTTAVRPMSGSIDSPVLASSERQKGVRTLF